MNKVKKISIFIGLSIILILGTTLIFGSIGERDTIPVGIGVAFLWGFWELKKRYWDQL